MSECPQCKKEIGTLVIEGHGLSFAGNCPECNQRIVSQGKFDAVAGHDVKI